MWGLWRLSTDVQMRRHLSLEMMSTKAPCEPTRSQACVSDLYSHRQLGGSPMGLSGPPTSSGSPNVAMQCTAAALEPLKVPHKRLPRRRRRRRKGARGEGARLGGEARRASDESGEGSEVCELHAAGAEEDEAQLSSCAVPEYGRDCLCPFVFKVLRSLQTRLRLSVRRDIAPRSLQQCVGACAHESEGDARHWSALPRKRGQCARWGWKDGHATVPCVCSSSVRTHTGQ